MLRPMCARGTGGRIGRCPSDGEDVACKSLFYQRNYGIAAGAGEGNRTLVFSLEGCCSTIELHPRRSSCRTGFSGKREPSLTCARLPDQQWWRGLDSNQRRLSQRIYSPSPLTTRAPLQTAAGAMRRGIFLPIRTNRCRPPKSAMRLMARRPNPVNRAGPLFRQ